MSNLSHQFDAAERTEDTQRRRFHRRRESGYVGNGYWFANYPYMIGSIAAGTITQAQSHEYENPVQMAPGDGTAGTSSGMGEGGTAVSGNAGGAPA